MSAEPNTPAPGDAQRLPLVLAGVALAGTVAVSLLAWHTHQSLANLAQSAGGRVADLGSELAQSRETLAGAQASLRTQLARLEALEARVVELGEGRAAVEEIHRELVRSADDRLIAEAEQLIILASQQLQLAGNVRAALTALQAADQRLARSDKPPVANLRRALLADMERLQALPLVDTVGLALRLDQLINAVDALPLVTAELPRAPVAAKRVEGVPSGLAAIAREFWNDLKSLVRVREISPGEAVLLAPEQAYFLKENLKLRLLAARVSLLARDEARFREDVRAAQAWVGKYADTRAKSGAAALTALAQLAESPVVIATPDINASLAAARAARERR